MLFRSAWKEQEWKKPEFDFSVRSDRVSLKLEIGQVVYIPGTADLRKERLEEQKSTDQYSELSKEQKVLLYLKDNGSITTQAATILCEYKTRAGARKLLEKMIQNGVLIKIGSGPATKYKMSEGQ